MPGQILSKMSKMKKILIKLGLLMATVMLPVFGLWDVAIAECLGTINDLAIYVNDDACPLTSEHNNPLFKVSNIAPGGFATGKLKIKNYSDQSQKVVIEAFDFADPLPDDNLARALEITISKGGTDIYGGNAGTKTLYQFFQDGEVYLSDIGSDASQEYNIRIYFPEEGGNEWQGKTTGFNLMMGFQGADKMGVTTTRIHGSSSGGDRVKGLTITNEAVVVVTETTATITWNTNYDATSWVIYAADGQNYEFDLSKENYGYPYSSEEDLNKIRQHSVTIAGLNPGTEYHFRCVSHASLAVSVDHSFTTLAQTGNVMGASTEKQGFGVLGGEGGTTENRPGGNNIGDGGNETGRVEGASTERDEDIQDYNNKEVLGEWMKNQPGESCKFIFAWQLFALLAVFGGIMAAIRHIGLNRKNNGNQKLCLKKLRNQWIVFCLAMLAAAVWIFLSRLCLSWMWSAAAAAIMVFLFVYDLYVNNLKKTS